MRKAKSCPTPKQLAESAKRYEQEKAKWIAANPKATTTDRQLALNGIMARIVGPMG